MINGILTHGVLGAAKCFAEGQQGMENCLHIMQRMGDAPDFATLLRVAVLNNYVGVPNLTERGTLRQLLGYSSDQHEFT